MAKILSDEALNDTSGFDSAEPAPAVEKPAEAPPGGEEVGEAAEEGDSTDSTTEGGEKAPKEENPVEKRIKGALKQRDEARNALRAEKAAKAATEARLAALEARLAGAAPAPQQEDAPKAPDPAAYEYGSLDDKYIQDMIVFKADQQIRTHFERLDQGRQQQELQQQANAEMARVQEQAKDIVVKGAAVFDDFEEVVWERGLREEYKLDKPTFDAITEADNPAEIAYALASDPKEAERVFRMTPTQQAKYVFAKDREISEQKTKAPRAPKAPVPAGQAVRGAGGRYGVAGDTEDLDAFEKEFFAKKK